MTERRGSIPVVAIAGALFCLLLIYLALQIRAGNDPAIGAGYQQAAVAPRQVVVRRVIITRVVEDAPAPAASGGGGGGGAVAFAPAASAPAAAAPAAPAPAPAPVVSSGS